MTHAFVMEFENDGDRDYYVSKDPEPETFVQILTTITDQLLVVDFTHGIY